MRFGSVCSGIEAASVAWEPLGWLAAWFAEIDAFPSSVLAHHWPNVPNMGDMTTLAEYIRLGYLEAPDVLVGGTPCQAFSVAGARKSLDDERGQLSLEYIKLANAIDSQRIGNESIIVWENVPGVLNTGDNAFGCFLGALAGENLPLVPSGGKWTNAGCVFGPQRAVAWRILDAQYFGVAQRRRRVFVVASARKGFDPCEVLFEFDGVRRDSPPSRDQREDPACGTGESLAGSGRVVVHGTQDPIINEGMAFPLGRNSGQENVVYSIMGNHIGRRPENGGNATEPGFNISPCLTKTDRHAVAYALQGSMIGRSDTAGPQGSGVGEGVSFTLTAGDRHAVAYSVIGDVTPKIGDNICMTLRAQGGGGIVPPSVKPPQGRVRRLTPKECERLQGFPDDHTSVPYRNKSAEDCPDGPRYAACGNSMAVPVMRWIGKRIDKVVNSK